jgi:RNA polymerase sigma-70 factor (ECF subfamily)
MAARTFCGRPTICVVVRDQSDAVIIDESLRRPAVFSALYERHLDAVARYVARRVGVPAAEDLTAEVFVRAFRARARYRPERTTALPWLLGIASNVVADNRRAERRRLAALERLVADAATHAPRSDNQLSADLVRRLRSLPARDRDALLLVVWGELSYEEAAETLEVPIGTVRSRISRARARLAIELDRDALESRYVPGGTNA